MLCISLSFLLLNCNDEKPNDTDNPIWLEELIDEIENDSSYVNSIIYRHTWKNDYYYHLYIYYSSCQYCNVYNNAGVIIDWESENNLNDYLNNRKDEKIIWQY